MNKRIISVILSLCMLLAVMPQTALAETVSITVDSEGNIVTDEYGNYPPGVRHEGSYYSLDYGHEYKFSGNMVYLGISNYGTIMSGDFTVVNNFNIISGGTFHDDYGGSVDNEGGSIDGGTFNSTVTNKNGTITNGTFNGLVTNQGGGTITGGTFNGLVTNYGTITGGTFNGKILNMGGTVASNVRATVAQGGSLGITKQNLGSGSITVKQNGIDIPSGAAGEVYNVAGFDDTLIGLYLLPEGSPMPSEPYEIDTSVFTPVTLLGRLTQYDFTMPNTPVTVLAVFSDYRPATELAVNPYLISGTDASSIENAEPLEYELKSVVPGQSGVSLSADSVGKFITIGNATYEFAGFIIRDHDEASGNTSYSLAETMNIPAEPGYNDTEGSEWQKWYTEYADGISVAYRAHTHAYDTTKHDENEHWQECVCGEETGREAHNLSGWTSNKDDTHSRSCNTDGCGYSQTDDCVDEDGDEICDLCRYDMHKHTYEWRYNDGGHWRACVKGDVATMREEHVFDNDEDTDCQCGYVRTIDTEGDTAPDEETPSDIVPGEDTPTDTTPVTYSVYFFSNTPTEGKINKQTMNEGEEQNLHINQFTRRGYLFTGWNTKQDGSGTAYADGASITLTEDIYLFAQWAQIQTVINKFTSDDISDELRNKGYDTPVKIEDRLKNVVYDVGVRDGNTVFYNFDVLISNDDGKTWVPVSGTDLPINGRIPVSFPVPEGANASDNDFYGVHMFSENAFGKIAGDTETVAFNKIVIEGTTYLEGTLTGTSPLLIGWKEEEISPKTGDMGAVSMIKLVTKRI